MAEHFIQDDMAERGVREADYEYRDGKWRSATGSLSGSLRHFRIAEV